MAARKTTALLNKLNVCAAISCG